MSGAGRQTPLYIFTLSCFLLSHTPCRASAWLPDPAFSTEIKLPFRTQVSVTREHFHSHLSSKHPWFYASVRHQVLFSAVRLPEQVSKPTCWRMERVTLSNPYVWQTWPLGTRLLLFLIKPWRMFLIISLFRCRNCR